MQISHPSWEIIGELESTPVGPRPNATAPLPITGASPFWFPTQAARRRRFIQLLQTTADTQRPLVWWGQQLEAWHRARKVWAIAFILSVLLGSLLLGCLLTNPAPDANISQEGRVQNPE